MEANTHRPRAVCVWHRRAGKDFTVLNICATKAFERVGLYWHVFPTYNQGRKIAWQGKNREGVPFLSAFPDQLIDSKNNTEMRITLVNGSIYQVVGADDPDRLVGSNPVGIIFSEWSLMSPVIWKFLRPILTENGGWAIFIYTPRGKNHGYRLYELAQKEKGWFCSKLSVDDTRAVDPLDIEADRREGMDEATIQQEYYCSFDAPVEGAYYENEFNWLYKQEPKRLAAIPHEPKLPVHTAWDIGSDDDTAIIFFQQYGQEIRIIDCLSDNNQSVAYYWRKLQERANSEGYNYGMHLAPHDIKVTEWGTGKTRFETARELGLKFKILPRLDVQDGIDATRMILKKCWFDQVKCESLIDALVHYHKEKDEKKQRWANKPFHDWSSHFADAMRYLALGIKDRPKKRDKMQKTANTDYDIFEI